MADFSLGNLLQINSSGLENSLRRLHGDSQSQQERSQRVEAEFAALKDDCERHKAKTSELEHRLEALRVDTERRLLEDRQRAQRDLEELRSAFAEQRQRMQQEMEALQQANAEKARQLEETQRALAESQEALQAARQDQERLLEVAAASKEREYDLTPEQAEEKAAFVAHINERLTGRAAVRDYLPLSPIGNGFFACMPDGVVLSLLLNDSVPNALDERVVLRAPLADDTARVQNLNLFLNSAKGVGADVRDVPVEGVLNADAAPCLNAAWSAIRMGLLANVSLRAHPELVRLVQGSEEAADLLKLSPEELLLRWVNWQLQTSGATTRQITNFREDLRDSEVVLHLLYIATGGRTSLDILGDPSLEERAKSVDMESEKVHCSKFISPQSILGGFGRLNLAFIADLFNKTDGAMAKLSDAEQQGVNALMAFDEEGTREERAFRFWLRSLGVDVNNLFEDVNDGIALLQTWDVIDANCVDWKKVKMNPRNVYQKGENCNYVVAIGHQHKFSLVGIDGTDIVQKNKKLILALIWQMMRYNLVATIRKLSQGGRDITDKELVAWANSKVAASGKSSSISDTNDPTISNGAFLLDLCNAVRPGVVNYDMVTPGVSAEEKELNAKYALSVARAIGGTLFCLWEDLVEVNTKMIVCFIATLMLCERNQVQVGSASSSR